MNICVSVNICYTQENLNTKRNKRMRVFRNIILIAIFIIVVILAVFNSGIVTFNYAFGAVQLPLIIFLLISLIIGVLIGMLTMFQHARRSKAKLKEKLTQ